MNRGTHTLKRFYDTYIYIIRGNIYINKPAFPPKSNCKPSPAHPNMEIFVSQLEKEIFNGLLNDYIYTI